MEGVLIHFIEHETLYSAMTSSSPICIMTRKIQSKSSGYRMSLLVPYDEVFYHPYLIALIDEKKT
jgi:hypothetical protein